MFSPTISTENRKSFFDINEQMLTVLGTTVTPSKAKTFVPIYQLLSSVGNSNSTYAKCSDNDEQALIFSSDYVHPSIFGQKSFAYQVLGWLYYTLMS